MIRPQAAAAAAKLEFGDMITSMNDQAVTDIDEFKKDYEDFRKNSPDKSIVFVISKIDGRQETINIEPPQQDQSPAASNFPLSPVLRGEGKGEGRELK